MTRSTRFLLALAMVCSACSKHDTPPAVTSASINVSASSAAAGNDATQPLTTFGYGPPWGPEWCISKDALDGPPLAKKYLPPGINGDLKTRKCSAGMFIKESSLEMHYAVSCGEERVPAALASGMFPMDPDLGVNTRVQELPKGTSVDALDTDVPCEVSTYWYQEADPSNNRKKALALTKDVLAMLTPERIKAPRVAVVYAAQDTTGDAARAALATFKERAATVQTYAPLHPGFPKVVKSDDYPGLEPGKYFLLFGICSGGWEDEFRQALDPALPVAYDYDSQEYLFKSTIIDGYGLQNSCPVTISHNDLGTMSAAWKLDEERFLTATAINSFHVMTPGQIRFRAAAFLYSSKGQLLDTITVQEPYPSPEEFRDQYGQLVKRTYDDCRAILQPTDSKSFSFGCHVNRDDQECSEKPFTGKTYSLSVSNDNKLSLDSHTGISGGSCKPKNSY